MTELRSELREYLATIETHQNELAELQARKDRALRRAHAAELLGIAKSEDRLVGLLQAQLGRREALLHRARDEGHPVGSITDLVARLDESPELQASLGRTTATAERLQRETWSHWIIARRTVGQYDDVLELIAHHGERSPTYSSHSNAAASTGGAVLDASA